MYMFQQCNASARNENKSFATDEVPEVRIDEDFIKNLKEVEVEKISRKDTFMTHHPKSEIQAWVMDAISFAKLPGINMRNFFVPRCDPSISEDGKIVYVKGAKPAFGYSAEQWNKCFMHIAPTQKSRNATIAEYYVLLGTIIKSLVEENGYSVSEAWYNVCDVAPLNRNGKLDDKQTNGDKYFDIFNTDKYIWSFRDGLKVADSSLIIKKSISAVGLLVIHK